MSKPAKFLVFLLIVAATNAATFVATTWRCRQELAGEQRSLTALRERTDELQGELGSARSELDRLSVWGDFIRMQQDLNRVSQEINELNYGNAIEAVDEVANRLTSGGYGERFQEHQARLLPLLDRTKQALRQKQDDARVPLVELNQRAFELLSGIAAPRDVGPPATTPPTPGADAAETAAQDAPQGPPR